MNENDESCDEINELIYQLAGEFWKQAYCRILGLQNELLPDDNISKKDAISQLRKELKNFAKENDLKHNAFSQKEHYYISLIPYPIYIGIEKRTGDFTIATPHISTRLFTYKEWKLGIKWIQDYINIDVRPLTEKTSKIMETFYLNTKTSEIVETSIKALCDSIQKQNHWDYRLIQNRLRSDIAIQTDSDERYEIVVFHKAFCKDSGPLLRILKNLCEEEIEDKIRCRRVFA